MQTEHVFDIKNATHVDGTNRYTFKFPEHWRQQPNKALTIGIRGIKLIYAPYDLGFKMTVVYYDKQTASPYEGNSNCDLIKQVPLNWNMNPDVMESNQTLSSQNPNFITSVTDFMFASGVNNAWYTVDPFTADDFNLKYDNQKRKLTFEIVASVTDARKLKYFKLDHESHGLTGWGPRIFSDDLQKLLNLPLDILASGNTPARDGFLTAVAKICNTTDVFPADQKRMYEQFSRTFADTLKHVKIQFRSVTGYQIRVEDVPPPPIDGTPEESEGELEL
jgi:hypothetical protein